MSDTMTNPQDIVAAARQMLAASGAPMTAENLNRAMLAIGDPTGAPQFDMNAAIERSMTPRGGVRGGGGRLPHQQPRSTPSGAAPAQDPGPPQITGPMQPNEQAAFDEANAAPQGGSAAPTGARRTFSFNDITNMDPSTLAMLGLGAGGAAGAAALSRNTALRNAIAQRLGMPDPSRMVNSQRVLTIDRNRAVNKAQLDRAARRPMSLEDWHLSFRGQTPVPPRNTSLD